MVEEIEASKTYVMFPKVALALSPVKHQFEGKKSKCLQFFNVAPLLHCSSPPTKSTAPISEN